MNINSTDYFKLLSVNVDSITNEYNNLKSIGGDKTKYHTLNGLTYAIKRNLEQHPYNPEEHDGMFKDEFISETVKKLVKEDKESPVIMKDEEDSDNGDNEEEKGEEA